MPKVICAGCRFFEGMAIIIKESPYADNEEGFCQNKEIRWTQLRRRGAIFKGQGNLDARGNPMMRYSKTPRNCDHREET